MIIVEGKRRDRYDNPNEALIIPDINRGKKK
jgi:hypothetical protein